MSEHHLKRIDLHPPDRFHAVCSCGWRSESVMNAGIAGAAWDAHVAVAPVVSDVEPAGGDAARELYAELVPALKDAVRAGVPASTADGAHRMERLAAALGEREARVAAAVRRQWDVVGAEGSARDRAAVIVGLVELGDRARVHLTRRLPVAPDPARADAAG